MVANVRSASLAAEGRESIYVPYVFQSFLPLTFVVRTKVDAATSGPQIRSVVAAMDKDVPVAGTTTLESYVTNAMAQTRFLLALISTFAVLAVVLASLGLYGVISYSARQRTREIGVRVALGASSRDVVRLILGQGMAVAAIGIVLGLGGAIAADACREELPRWRERGRSNHVRRRSGDPVGRHCGGVVLTGEARERDRSGDGAARGVIGRRTSNGI